MNSFIISAALSICLHEISTQSGKINWHDVKSKADALVDKVVPHFLRAKANAATEKAVDQVAAALADTADQEAVAALLSAQDWLGALAKLEDLIASGPVHAPTLAALQSMQSPAAS